MSSDGMVSDGGLPMLMVQVWPELHNILVLILVMVRPWIVGGGGAARSTAHTWQQLGGKVKMIFGGNRELNDYEWIETMQ